MLPPFTCLDGWGGPVAFEGDDEGYAAKRICRIHNPIPNVSFSGQCFDGLKQEGESRASHVAGNLPNHHLGGLHSIPRGKNGLNP